MTEQSSNIFHHYIIEKVYGLNNLTPLQKMQLEVDKITQREKEILEQFKEYCQNRKFRIVKHIYYSGYQGDLIGRECILKPCIYGGKLQASCKVYNKRTKKIDIDHYYIHDMSFYEEIKDAK